MKKSLLVTLDFPPTGGGVSNYLSHLISHFPENDIIVLTTPAAKSTITTPYRVYRRTLLTSLPLIWPRWLILFLRTFFLVLKERIALVQVGQILPIGTVAFLIKKILNIPYLVYTYGLDLTISMSSPRRRKLIRSIIAQADGIITISNFTKNELLSLGAQKEKIVLAYPAASLRPKPVPPGLVEETRSRYGLRGKKILLTVGRLVERKGHDLVIRSLPTVLKILPDLQYIIIGEGPHSTSLQKQIRRSNLQDRVILFNKSLSDEELQLWYRLCDVFIMPARLLHDQSGAVTDVEGFGLVFLEANLFGKPVIGGRTGGQAEAIKDGFSGLLVDPENEQEIAEAIIKLLTNPALAKKLGQQGQRRAQEQFQCPKEAEKIITHINTI